MSGDSAAWLVLVSDVGLGRRYRLGASTVIGRHEACDLQLVDARVSKHHARITLRDGGYHVADLDSRNGVFLNGGRIQGEAALAKNDALGIGEHLFLVDPDVELLPEDDGAHVVVVTPAATVLGEAPAQSQSSSGELVTAVLSAMAGAADARLQAGLTALRDRLPFDAAAVVLGDRVAVVSARRTLSIPRAVSDAVTREGRALLIPDALGDATFSQGKTVTREQVRSVIAAPLSVGDLAGLVYLTRDAPNAYDAAQLRELARVAPAFALALATSPAPAAPAEALDDGSTLLGASPAIERVRALVRKAAPTRANVLVLGETGTGKELVARELHRLGPCPDGPFVAVNCGAVPEQLMESEFFGHERGAFTGADRMKPGRLELASGGTLFLDEVGDLPAALQVKLLRALEERSFYRVGGVKPVRASFRLVAATHRDLAALAHQGRFREDLYFRLNVVRIDNPRLAERRDDIPALAQHFLQGVARELDKPVRGFSEAALATLVSYAWPGNVRELRNLVERAAVLCDGELIEAADLSTEVATPTPAAGAGQRLSDELATLERELVKRALREARGKKSAAAAALGISRPTLDKKIRDYRIDIFEETP